MTRWAGRLLITIAPGPLLLALGGVLPQLPSLAPGGLLSAVHPSWAPAHLPGQLGFWTTLGNFAFPQLFWGWLLVQPTSWAPAVARPSGWALLTLTGCQVALAPVSGFWLNFLPAALLITAGLSARHSTGAPAPVGLPQGPR